MSVVLSLTSAAIIAGVSLSSVAITALIDSKMNAKNDQSICVDTIFTDSAILKKTLEDYGSCVEEVTSNDYQVQTKCGTLHYFRQDETMPFQLILENVENVERRLFICEKSFQTLRLSSLKDWKDFPQNN